jgi:hypothetical protein
MKASFNDIINGDAEPSFVGPMLGCYCGLQPQDTGRLYLLK